MKIPSVWRHLSFIIAFSTVAAQVFPATADDAAQQDAGSEERSSSDAEALNILTAINENEIRAAEEALKKKADPEVLDYASMMQKEHTKNLEKTRELAKKVGATAWESAAVAKLRAQGEEDLSKLKALEGDEFNGSYMDMMVKGHGEALDMIDNKLSRSAKNDAVKEHLHETRERVNAHLREAEDIVAALKK
jgi:putative membrane protein